MKFKNQNLIILGDKFSGKIHEAFKNSSINKLYNDIEIDRLIIYNEVLGEFIDLGYYDLYDEFEDRICNGECPNELLCELIGREEYMPTLGYLLGQIEYFIDKDYMKYFK